MATPGRRTFSGAVVACAFGVAVGLGWVPAAAHQATTAADPARVVGDACPLIWSPLRPDPPGDNFDGHVSVLVGGNLTVAGGTRGAEGVVVVAGDATFVRDDAAPYRVGVTGTGSQVPPHADSDMLVVGGNLSGGPGNVVEVGRGLGADAVVGGAVDGTTVELFGGTLDAGVAGPLAPYDSLLADLAAKSGAYAARPVTGTADVTDSAVTLTGDGVSDPQVFDLDGATVGAKDGEGEGGGGTGRSLQVLGVPDGAGVVVNLTGPAVDLDLDSLLGPAGETIDPSADGYFAGLTTHLLWNVPGASTVDLGGQAQLPGSLLVGVSPSTTTIHGAGTNGRVLVAGDLVHTGTGELHSYPFLPDPDLTCGPDLEHLGALTLDVVLEDPGHIVDPERFFEGTFTCFLAGQDVTPGDGTWQLRAQADDRVLSEAVPVEAECFLQERLVVPPANGWDWARAVIAPARVTIAKRDPRGSTVTNSVQPVEAPAPPEPEPTTTPEPTVPTTSAPDATPSGPVEPETADPEAVPTSPTDEPVVPVEAVPSMLPAPEVTPPWESPAGDGPVAAADPPPAPDSAGPLTTTAPYSLRGVFVWGPLLLLSVLALRLRFPWRPKRRKNQSYY